jgi:hypothetical protein
MTLRHLLASGLASTLCAACVAVTPGATAHTTASAPVSSATTPPAQGQTAAPTQPAVVYTEDVVTPLSDGTSRYVCNYVVPTGTRIPDVACRLVQDPSTENSDARETARPMMQGVTAEQAIINNSH